MNQAMNDKEQVYLSSEDNELVNEQNNLTFRSILSNIMSFDVVWRGIVISIKTGTNSSKIEMDDSNYFLRQCLIA